MDIKFINYTPTPTEQKQMGIAEILYGDITLRFKIVHGKEGDNFFITPASHKIGERYYGAFEIDSKSQYNSMIEFVRENVKTKMFPQREIKKEGSVFDTELPF